MSSLESDTLTRRSEGTISAVFESVAAHFPQSSALSSSDQSFTYNELNHAANRLAHAIMNGVGANCEPVVLVAERDVWSVIGLLSILKAGKCCVPIHPANNEERILAPVLAEMKPKIILTHGEWVNRMRDLAPHARVLDIEYPNTGLPDTNPELFLKPDDLAFVIYTSGSTGSPKGVMHNHRNILHRIFWYAERFDVGTEDCTMMLSSADHISGVVGILRPLLTGGRLYILNLRQESFDGLGCELQAQRCTILPIVNTVFRRFVDNLPEDVQFPDLRMIIVGGEPPQIEDITRLRHHFSNDCIMLNTLGCTELPTYRYFVIKPSTVISDGVIPAGHAVPGTEVVLVDLDDDTSQQSQSKEIVVRSRYLAMGYWKRTEETADRFKLAEDGTRMFRTGDLGRMRSDGMLVHLGRSDWLVKILGNRVELVEVENTLRQHLEVNDVAVITWPDAGGDLQLYAYIVTKSGASLDVHGLKSFVRARLPDYMVPLEILFVGDLPLTRTGKVDRRALPNPHSLSRPRNLTNDAPRTDMEKLIANICCDVLNCDSIGLHEDLFDRGANSLLAMLIVNRLSLKLGARVAATLPFRAPTVALLAEQIHTQSRQNIEITPINRPWSVK